MRLTAFDPRHALAKLAPTVTAYAIGLAAIGVGPLELSAQDPMAMSRAADEQERLGDRQLDNLLGPIALYPDALLAQVLVAATFPEQVDDAARFVRANGTDRVDAQSWDVSVKSVAHYPSALNLLADRLEWTAAIGRAYATQSSDVMASVQRLRALADQQGNLVSTPEQQVVREQGAYVIVPARPRVIYVPVYDPVVIYSRPVFRAGVRSPYWTFGVGFPIGGWLIYDCNWGLRTVYYNGWNDGYFEYGGGWRARARPYINITTVYVRPRVTQVFVNRDISRRRIDYGMLDRGPRLYGDTYFDRRRDGDRRDGDRRDGDRRDNEGRGGDRRPPEPRIAQPRGAEPRGPEPRGNDPRGNDPRGNDPRGQDRRPELPADRIIERRAMP
ncbi:MAG: DUF3300 domain-containing protein, partial [Gemmatimonadaceae bacterium]